jgi:CDP-glucose 4,6-dehydratase
MSVRSCYRDPRVLVTGLTGFKGVWLGEWLRQLGATVTGLALPPDDAMSAGWPGLADRFPCAFVDVADAAAVTRVLAEGQPEIVFHLAAQPLVRAGYAEPVATFAANVLGTAHVLEAARRTASVRAVVAVTSDKCYENDGRREGYREGDPLGGHDPYSASKACSEIVAASYRRSFGMAVATARAGNVIGGGDWAADRLVPDLVRGVLAGEPLVLRRPTAVRPWQHVLEALSGYLLLGERLLSAPESCASAWKFGPAAGETLTVRELARQMVRCWGRGQVVEAAGEVGPHEAAHLTLSSSRAEAELGWRPLLTPAERVSWSVDWYAAWERDPASVWDVTARQIEEYERRVVAQPAAPERLTRAA